MTLLTLDTPRRPQGRSPRIEAPLGSENLRGSSPDTRRARIPLARRGKGSRALGFSSDGEDGQLFETAADDSVSNTTSPESLPSRATMHDDFYRPDTRPARLGSRRSTQRFLAGAVAIALSTLTDPWAAVFAQETADDAEIAAFGFRSLEIFRVEGNAGSIRSADLNQDGRLDLVVANNSDGTLRVLLQRDPKAAAEAAEEEVEVNVVPSDRRFEVRKIYTDRENHFLEVGDFDGDGRTDLATWADPPELEILYQQGEGFHASTPDLRKQTFSIRDSAKSLEGLHAGDLNGDGRTDLFYLGGDQAHLLYQKTEGGLGAPQTLHLSSQKTGASTLADVDSDGHLDIIYLRPSDRWPVIVRLGGASGFGPEIPSRLQPVQAWALGGSAQDKKGEGSCRLMTIQATTRRLQGFRWRAEPAEGGLTRPLLLPLGEEAADENSRRLLTDVDGDGLLDIAVSHPKTAEIEVHFQVRSEDGAGSDGFTKRVSYPALAQSSDLVALDGNRDGRPDLAVVSEKEKAIGLSIWKDGRLQIPRTTTLSAEPVRLAAGLLKRDDPKTAAAFIAVRSEEDPKMKVLVLTAQEDGKFETLTEFAVETEGAAPSELRVFDANGDGRNDLLVTTPYVDPYLFLQNAATDDEPAAFREVSRAAEFGLGQIAQLDPMSLTIDEGEASKAARWLVASGNYVRVLQLDPQERLEVVDQWNARSSNARVRASAVLASGSDASPLEKRRVVTFDEATGSLDILETREDGGREAAENLRLPKFEILGLSSADLDGDGRDDLVLSGRRKLGLLYALEEQEGFVEFLSHSIDKKDLGPANDLVCGDLNADGVEDVLVSTAPRYRLLFLTPEAASEAGAQKDSDPWDDVQLTRRLDFQIFEPKSFMRRATTLGPDQMIVADVDGDQLEDLILLIHDRILIYLQDTVS